MHISISLQHSKKEKAAAEAAEAEAEENSGKERKRIDELEAIQVREGERVFWDREKRGCREA